jgi:PKD domain
MNKRVTFAGPMGLLATALLAVGCSDSFSPRGLAFDVAPMVTEVTGLGQIGTGSPSPGNNVQTFTFDVKSDLTGTLTYTDYSIPASLQVGPTFPGTGITAFRTSSTACSDPTKGAEFDGTGQVVGETELLNFTVAVCDNGPAGSDLDFFSFSAPSISYSKSGTLTSGDITKPTGSSSGSLVVSTNTSGTSLPASGYAATVDGVTSQPVGINSSVTFTGLTATSHTVALSGVPANCTVSGGTSQTVTVPAGGTATAAFSVSCTATSGVEVSGTGQIGTGSPTPGNNVQTFTFDVKSDLTGTLTYTDYNIPASLQVGPTFPGTGITAFRTSSTACSDPTRGAEFDGTGQVVGETELLNFTVAVCDNGPAGSGLDFFSFSAPSISYSKSGTLTGGDIVKSTTGSLTTGQITVTTTTTGTSLPNGYTVTVDGSTSRLVGINSSVTFTGLAATSHTVALSGVPTNCSVSGGTSQTVTVPSGGTATAAFSVSCTTPPGTLTVTTSTSGSSLPSGYTVTVDGTTSQPIGINGSVTFTNLAATSHTVVLTGVPTNCTVSGGTSRTVTVPSGGTATVSYSVTCTTPNQPPTVSAGSDETVLLGILYTETASFSDPDNDGPWSYTIDWGDGSSTSGSTSSQGTISASHSYLLGSFTIRVTVTDSHGASGSDSKVLTVITQVPVLPGLPGL